MTAILVNGETITSHPTVADAKAAVQKEFDDMYGQPVPMKWWFDRHAQQWFGNIEGHDEIVMIKEFP